MLVLVTMDVKVNRMLTSTAAVVALAGAVGASHYFHQARQSTADNQLSGVSYEAPYDVPPPKAGESLADRQHQFDLLSWQYFVMLNWPSQPDGQPDPTRIIGQGGDHSTVWQHWMQDSDVLVDTGGTPPAWNQSTRSLPKACESFTEDAAGQKVLMHVSKIPEPLQSFVQAGGGALIDQNQQFVWYEIAMNQNMYEYILKHKLYKKSGQEELAEVVFPSGSQSNRHYGAISVKAAWKQLGEGDDPQLFHKVEALLYTAASDSGPASCKKAMLGLVGLHIAHKTENAPQWIWSTFEHASNAPDSPTTAAGKYNFYNTDCESCPTNQMPDQPWNPARPGKPTQVVRIDPLDPATVALNQQFQSKFASIDSLSVWRNYQLVGTQRPRRPQVNDQSIGDPWPRFLANTTMETYIQGRVPVVSSTCTGCHSRGTTVSNPAKFADYTFILSRVKDKD